MLQLLEVGPPVPQLPLPAEVHLLPKEAPSSAPRKQTCKTTSNDVSPVGISRPRTAATAERYHPATTRSFVPEEHSVATPHYHLGCNINGCGTSEADRIDSISAGLHIAAENKINHDYISAVLNEQCFVQAGETIAVNPITGTLARTTVLLDTGSNTTLISEKLVDQLGLPIVAVRDTNFTTVDAHTRVQCRYVLVRIILRTDKQGHGPTVEMVAMVKDKVLHGNINRPTLSDQDMKDIESKGYVLSEGRHGRRSRSSTFSLEPIT
ncbi:hypothetical protein L596_029507 [Steinernema carpocapsae]|uniref:Uncharacterized protein n=1 Tax=Steinernema carpocapsae TaxID=34508 RepID=A0A4U5LUV4_STECR|nr:hypothetical protein L596_029507 [Steinernema carpocapsae]